MSLQAIGGSAVNQTVKAIAIARSYLEEDLLDLYFQPIFIKLNLNNQEITAIRFTVTSQRLDVKEDF